MCVKPEFIYGHVCCKLRNSLGGYGGIKVVRIPDDLGGSSSHGRGSVVTKSAVVTAGDVNRGVFMIVAYSILPPFWSVSSFADFRCLNSYPLDQVDSGKFFRAKIYDWLKKGILLNWINFLHSRPEALCEASCAKTHFIHYLGGSGQANIRSNATLLQPCVCVCVFFFNEIANRERSESCYITHDIKKGNEVTKISSYF